MKTKKYYHYVATRNIRGFSLIEFLVASILSMIVLIAAGSGFFMARQLNDVATARLQVQQDLRHAANMIVRDARMAGSFGCYNMEQGEAQDGGNTVFNLSYNNGTNIQGSGVKVVMNAATTFTGASFQNFIPVANSKALVFQYGVGSTAVTNWASTAPNQIQFAIEANSELAGITSNMPLVVSSCKELDRLNGDAANLKKVSSLSQNSGIVTMNVNPAKGLSSAHVREQLMVLRYVVHVYLVGKPSASEPNGFYRFELGADGTWKGPQLLVKDVSSMDLQLGYVAQTGTNTACAAGNFDFIQSTASNFANNIKKYSPTLLRVRLNNNVIAAQGQSAVAAEAQAGNVDVYDIHATIRGGNRCADRRLI